MKNAEATTIYREFLWPSVSTWVAALILWLTIWLTMYPWNHFLGLALGAIAAVAMLGLALLRAKSIVLTDRDLQVGGVVVPLSELGEAKSVTGEDARLGRGPLLDPAAFVYFRGTTEKLVMVSIQSQVDPTPYWLFSCRRPEELVVALNQLKARN